MSNSSPSIPSQAQDKRGGEVATLIQTPNNSPQTYGDVRYAQSRDGADFPRDRRAKLGYNIRSEGSHYQRAPLTVSLLP